MAIFPVFSPTSMGSHVCFPKSCKLVWGSLRSLQRTAPTRKISLKYTIQSCYSYFQKKYVTHPGILIWWSQFVSQKPNLTWSHLLSPSQRKTHQTIYPQLTAAVGFFRDWQPVAEIFLSNAEIWGMVYCVPRSWDHGTGRFTYMNSLKSW